MRVAVVLALGLGLVSGPALAFQEQTMTVGPNTQGFEQQPGNGATVERSTITRGTHTYDRMRFSSGPIGGRNGPSFGFETTRPMADSADPYSPYYAAPGQRF